LEDKEIQAWQESEEELFHDHFGSAQAVHRRAIFLLSGGASAARKIPPLKPEWAWHIELSFVATCRNRVEDNIEIAYQPWQPESVLAHLRAGIFSDKYADGLSIVEPAFHMIKISLEGQRSPLIYMTPTMINFGALAAVSLMSKDTILETRGMDQICNTRIVQVHNPSLIEQTFKLESCSSECFEIVENVERGQEKQNWTIAPGETTDIQLRFVPEEAQVKYHATLTFSHAFGTSTLNLRGLGASADLSFQGLSESTPAINFGLCRVGVKNIVSVDIENGGFLSAPFSVSCTSKKHSFYLPGAIQGIFHGNCAPQSIQSLELCFAIDESALVGGHQADQEFNGMLTLRWKPVPSGDWEEKILLLTGGLGFVDLCCSKSSLDFGTLLIKQPKLRRFEIINRGNAVCNWSIMQNNDTDRTGFLLKLEPLSDTLQPGQRCMVTLVVTATLVNLLHEKIIVRCEGISDIELLAVGTVAAPHLVVPDLNFDIGVLRVGEKKTNAVRSSEYRQFRRQLSNSAFSRFVECGDWEQTHYRRTSVAVSV
jgi:hypothetical protein